MSKSNKKRIACFIVVTCLIMAVSSFIAPVPTAFASTAVYQASVGFSGTQGTNQWYYQRLNGGTYYDLTTYDSGNARWTYPTWVSVGDGYQHPDSGNDSVRKWVAPGDGTIDITGAVSKGVAVGDGTICTIKKNSTQLWSATITSTTGTNPTGVTGISVAAGDAIYFIVNMNGNTTSDTTMWDPTVTFITEATPTPTPTPTPTGGTTVYQASTGFSGTQGTNQWYYQRLNGGTYYNLTFDSENNRWSYPTWVRVSPDSQHPDSGNDSVRKWVAPGEGTIDITGGIWKAAAGDGTICTIKKNSTQLWSALVTSSTPINPTGVTGIAVAAGDAIYFIVNMNGNTNSDNTIWDPTITFTGGGGTPTPTPTPTPTTITVTVDDFSGSITYGGSGWGTASNQPLDYDSTEHYCNTNNSYAQFTFTGMSIQWLGKKGSNFGKADVYIDDVYQATVDTYTPDAPPGLFQQINYTKTGLENTSHTIRIVVTDQKNQSSSDYYQVIDAFIYTTLGTPTPTPGPTPSYNRIVINGTVEYNSHKPKVFAVFSSDGYNDLGSFDNGGYKLYRYTQGWTAYTIFDPPGDTWHYEDAWVADINGDGRNDIVLGGWGNRTVWAENPASNPYTTTWTVHIVDTTRFSHEVVAMDMNNDGKCDIVTTSGIYFQGATPDSWTFKSVGRSGQGTYVANMLSNGDGYNDVIAVYVSGGKNMITWFENPGHTGGNPVTGTWTPRTIDGNPGGDARNYYLTTMAFTAGDINGDGRMDLVSASQGEGPGDQKDARQVGDGLVWYEGPANPRTDTWTKHVINSTVGWVHAASILLADFNGDGYLDVNFAEQDQSRMRLDGGPSKRLGIFYNTSGNGLTWGLQVLSQYPENGAGGFNSEVGIVGNDTLPSIFTGLHGAFGDDNPQLLWRPE